MDSYSDQKVGQKMNIVLVNCFDIFHTRVALIKLLKNCILRTEPNLMHSFSALCCSFSTFEDDARPNKKKAKTAMSEIKKKTGDFVGAKFVLK